jgi:hypothetical protein
MKRQSQNWKKCETFSEEKGNSCTSLQFIIPPDLTADGKTAFRDGFDSQKIRSN